jgi:hypothetical protein
VTWNPDCEGPCNCPGEEPVITLGDIHKALTALTARGASLESIFWVMENQMPVGPTPDCPDHKLVQHRDMKRPWCNSCGRDTLGALIGHPRG